MSWLFAVLAVVVMGVAAVVATGRGGAMSQVYDDRPDVRVPADRPLAAADLRRVRFTTAVRGYRMAEVDALLDRLARELEEAEQLGAVGDLGRRAEPEQPREPRPEELPEQPPGPER